MSHPNTITFIHSIDSGEQLSCRQKALRKRIEESILLSAVNEEREIDQKEVNHRIFLEESSKKTYTISKSEIGLITEFVWDRGLCGPSNKRLMEELYQKCELPPTAIARRDKIATKVRNIYRTYRETKEMFQDVDQGAQELSQRLFGLLNCFKDCTGAQEALGACGIFIRAEPEGECKDE